MRSPTSFTVTPDLLTLLRRRLIEIDFKHKHRHAPTSLSALPIIAEIYERMDRELDFFILSKGHSCAALYAVLEHLGFSPDVTKVHPERDPDNGIEMTAGSLGHGLPVAVGLAHGLREIGVDCKVFVLLGDGECLEGTTWEALHLARRLDLQGRLFVYVDCNGYQGADEVLDNAVGHATMIFPMILRAGRPGDGVKFFEDRQGETVHAITAEEYPEILEGIK